MAKFYDRIKELLIQCPYLRDSDKKLIWTIWNREYLIINASIPYVNFLEATSPETIRRTRQKVQQDHPELQSSRGVKAMKDKKEKSKGTFVYREEIKEQKGLF